MEKTKYMIVFVTVPDKKTAKIITESILNKKLAACVNIIDNLNSVYWWNNKIESSKELLLIMKSIQSKYCALEKEIKKLHPYEVPEVTAVDIKAGSRDYLKWISQYAG